MGLLKKDTVNSFLTRWGSKVDVDIITIDFGIVER